MRILIITASLPYPPASGGAIRTYGIIKGLHEAGHTITLMSFHDRDISAQDTPLAQYCEQIITQPPPQRGINQRLQQLLLTGKADIATRFFSKNFAAQLRALIQENDFDLIQFEAIEAGCYIPIAREANTGAKLVFDTFNAEAELQKVIYQIDRQSIKTLPKAIYSQMQSQRIFQYEGDLCRAADAVIAVSEEDHALLKAYRKDERTYIVPSGISVDSYQPPAEQLELGKAAVVFTGKMDYRPNVDAMLWFVESIWGEIKQRQPAAQLYIVGQKPNAAIQALGDRADITVTGWVDAIAPYLYAAAVYIAPLRMGSGTRLKLLEAMASGCAIVATHTAAAGLSADVKTVMRLADEPAQFAESVVDLLSNPAKRDALTAQTRNAVQQHYDWSVLIPRLLNIYEDIGLG